MKRLTHEADFGLEEWEQTLYSVNSDQGGAYNILDIANHKGEEEFDEILKTISLGLKHYEDTGLTPEQIRELKERDTARAPNKKLRHRGGFETFHCPNCDTSYQMDRRYTITDEYCPKCGKLLDSSFRSFCANCGQRLEEGR